MTNSTRFLLAALLAGPAYADDVLHLGTPELDRPTLTVLGVAVPLTGDDNYNSRIEVRYRAIAEEAWRNALPLFRVRPETVSGWKVRPQFAGSIFDLLPGTTYEIELRAIDPDGDVDSTLLLTAATRPVPSGPGSPNEKRVSDARELSAALAAARPGDVILLANGNYTGQFGIRASGEPANPIVIRGESQDGAVLDGGGCTGCNVLEVYGSFVYLERLTIRNGLRALRFQGSGAEGNVVRRVTIRDTTLGIGSRENQKDFYICDNVLEGRLPWPFTYFDDNGMHANDDGIRVQGFGHVVCHNRISGYGDAIKTEQDGARAIDFYGNDVLYTYDNGLELDGSEGNTRALRNRFTNNFVPLSVQPVYGGPVYMIRNVALNAVHEQMKFHALGGNPPKDPSGILAFHNTFVSPGLALNLQTTATSHHFVVTNNLFIGPDKPAGGLTVDWTGLIDNGMFDYNGYFPDGRFRFSRTFPNFAAAQENGVETHGVLLNGRIFSNGLIAPTDHKSLLAPDEAVIGTDSPAVDRAVALPGINDRFTGAAPDLGAHEAGCLAPLYGPRPEGVDESITARCPE